MPIDVRWDEATGRQIIHFRQVGRWTWDEYDAGVDESIRLLESVNHPVTILHDLTEAKTNAKSVTAFRHFMAAMERWQAIRTYAQFWIVLKPSYWEQITLWVLQQIYNPYQMVVATSLEDARKKALTRLQSMSPHSTTDELPDST